MTVNHRRDKLRKFSSEILIGVSWRLLLGSGQISIKKRSNPKQISGAPLVLQFLSPKNNHERVPVRLKRNLGGFEDARGRIYCSVENSSVAEVFTVRVSNCGDP